jgi:hypothetical protein
MECGTGGLLRLPGLVCGSELRGERPKKGSEKGLALWELPVIFVSVRSVAKPELSLSPAPVFTFGPRESRGIVYRQEMWKQTRL